MDLQDLANRWITTKYSQKEFADSVGLSLRSCQRKLSLARKHGLLLKIVSWRRSHSEELVQTICYLYEHHNFGYDLVSRKLGLASSTVRDILARQNVKIRTDAQCAPSGLPRRKRRQRYQEFSDRVKIQRFLEENGLCQECHLPIGDRKNWRIATYHHILPCRKGGGANLENCMVLHKECHNDPEIFKRLHGNKLFFHL